jgi:hypothetical protein
MLSKLSRNYMSRLSANKQAAKVLTSSANYHSINKSSHMASAFMGL